MLTSSFKDSIQSAPAAGTVPQHQPMTPEQFQAWSAPTPTSNTGQNIKDVGIGVAKTAAGFAQGSNVLDTMQRMAAGEGLDKSRLNIAEPFNALGATREAAGQSRDWTGMGQPQPQPGAPSAFTGQTPEQQREAFTPSNIAQKIGSIGAQAALAFSPMATEVGPGVMKGISKATQDFKPVEIVPPDAAAAAQKTKVNDQAISDLYTKAIKPTIVGKTAPGQVEKYAGQVSSAVKSIVKNKPNLTLVDSFGDPAKELPQTIDQFRQSIEQTKASIFKQYDAMASAAGDKGAVVDLHPIAVELNKVATNNIVNDLHPDLAAYAAERAKTLLARGKYSTPDAQEAVQNLNRSLDAYYRNPSYETASKASIDSLIANQLRGGLDSVIENSGSPGYQALRDQYSALKGIEKDVIKRGIVEARQTGGRGLNIGDMVSAEELIRGLATHNPAAMVTAGAIKGLQALRRYLTDPNRAVRKMFEKADQNQASDSQALPQENSGSPYQNSPNTSDNIQPATNKNTMSPTTNSIDSSITQPTGKASPQGGLLEKGRQLLSSAKDNMNEKGAIANPFYKQPADLSHALETIKTSGGDWDNSIGTKPGDLPKEQIYTGEVGGPFTPAAADHVVSDLVGKMNMVQKGLGDGFKTTVDVSNPTRANLLAQAEQYIKSKQGDLSVKNVGDKTPDYSPELHDSVLEELHRTDTTPATINGAPDLSNTDVQVRLGQLQEKSSRVALNKAEIMEAYDLLKKSGIDPLSASKMGGEAPKARPTPIRNADNTRLAGSQKVHKK